MLQVLAPPTTGPEPEMFTHGRTQIDLAQLSPEARTILEDMEERARSHQSAQDTAKATATKAERENVDLRAQLAAKQAQPAAPAAPEPAAIPTDDALNLALDEAELGGLKDKVVSKTAFQALQKQYADLAAKIEAGAGDIEAMRPAIAAAQGQERAATDRKGFEGLLKQFPMPSMDVTQLEASVQAMREQMVAQKPGTTMEQLSTPQATQLIAQQILLALATGQRTASAPVTSPEQPPLGIQGSAGAEPYMNPSPAGPTFSAAETAARRIRGQ